MKDQAQRLRELAARAGPGPEPLDGPGRVLAVASGKGGVGKTSMVANLGVALAKQGHPVTVLDADFGLANLDILLNLAPRRNLSHLVRGEAAPEEVVVEVAPGFRVIPGGSGVDGMADLDAADRDRLLARVGPLVAGASFLLIDTAAGIGRNVVDLCVAAGDVLLVTNAEPTSLTDAYGLVKVVWGRDPEVGIAVMVNSAESERDARGIHARLDRVVGRFLGRSVGYAGHVVRDDHVRRAALRQTPFVTAYPRCAASRCVEEIARSLVAREPSRPAGAAGFWGRLLGVSP